MGIYLLKLVKFNLNHQEFNPISYTLPVKYIDENKEGQTIFR